MKKKKGSIVPTAPKEPFLITQKAVINLERWISYLKGLSPRVVIKMPKDNDFNLDILEKIARQMGRLTEDDYIIDWPKQEDVAFILCFDSSLPNQEPKFLDDNITIFCFYNLAFNIRYFESNGDENGDGSYNFSLNNYSEHALSWNYLSLLLKQKLEEIEKSVCTNPMDQDE